MLEKGRTKDEKELYNFMKVFARYNTPENHEKLVKALIKEKQIKEKIEELIMFKR